MTKRSLLTTRRQTFGLAAIAAAYGATARAAGAAVAPAPILTPSAGVCLLLPETTEGPYYFDPKLERADITESHPGIPLTLDLAVVDSACAPVKGARVDVWHCNAAGLYSGYARQGDDGRTSMEGQTFLRGTQFTQADGRAAFTTIYPGWYRGRTTHIHFKVFLDARSVMTGQIFFPDALSEFIYQNHAAYHREAQRDTLNEIDDIAQGATDAAQAAIREEKGRYVASLIIGVDPAADGKSGQTGPGGRPGGPGGPPPGPPPGGMPPGPPPEGVGPPGGPGGPNRPQLDAAQRLRAIFPGESVT